MKTNTICFLFLALSLNLLSAQNKNWQYSAKFITADEIYLSIDGEAYEGAEFPIGSEAKLFFEGVKGFKTKMGKVYPTMVIKATEKRTGKTIVEANNLLSTFTQSGAAPNEAQYLSAYLNINESYKIGQQYLWEILIADDIGKGQIKVKYEFQVAPKKQGSPSLPQSIPTSTRARNNSDAFFYENEELFIEGVSLQVDNRPYSYTDLPYQKTVEMVFDKVEGFTKVNGMVFPGMAIRVTDQYGREILKEKDLFANYNNSGISPFTARTLSSQLTIGNPMQLGKTYTWEVIIWDKEWPKRTVEATLEFKVLH